MNKVILIGRVGKDPETRYMPSGAMIADCSLATSRRWKDKNTNEKREETAWHNLVFFGKIAEVVNQYVKKGSRISVEGEIEYQQWEKDGQKKYRTIIRCSGLELLDSANGQGQSQNQGGTKWDGNSAPDPEPYDDFDDDIPF